MDVQQLEIIAAGAPDTLVRVTRTLIWTGTAAKMKRQLDRCYQQPGVKLNVQVTMEELDAKIELVKEEG